MAISTISVIDSHTGGEPTRIIVDGGPDLGSGTMAERAQRFLQDFDHIRTSVIAEPRGSDVMVGGILCEPVDPSHSAGIVFFDNAGLLGMCGHGTIGFAVTLRYLGRLSLGSHTIETPVGNVGVELLDSNTVRIQNVPSRRVQKDVQVNVPGHGLVIGDIAWGGNWFFITEDCAIDLDPSYADELLRYTNAIRRQLKLDGHTGDDGSSINHVEIQAPAKDPSADGKNFVLCPGGAYDRSPCGTGTSAKLACLASDGKLAPEEMYRQESIVGSVFETSYVVDGDSIIPSICGKAYVSGEAKLILDPADPFCHGIIG